MSASTVRTSFVVPLQEFHAGVEIFFELPEGRLGQVVVHSKPSGDRFKAEDVFGAVEGNEQKLPMLGVERMRAAFVIKGREVAENLKSMF